MGTSNLPRVAARGHRVLAKLVFFLTTAFATGCEKDLVAQDPRSQPVRVDEVVVASGTVLLPCTLIQVPTRKDSAIVVILPGSGRIDRNGNVDGETKPGPDT